MGKSATASDDGGASDAGPLRPGTFAQLSLAALAAAEGRRRRRKRDQTPDAIGLAIRRELLERVAADDPLPEAFEGWLLRYTLCQAASGPVRALCVQIFEEYRFAAQDPAFGRWLAAGAPSADADEG